MTQLRQPHAALYSPAAHLDGSRYLVIRTGVNKPACQLSPSPFAPPTKLEKSIFHFLNWLRLRVMVISGVIGFID